MEGKKNYVVEITPEAEFYYLQLIEYLYQTHSIKSAERKADEILSLAMSLDRLPNRGTPESKLDFPNMQHRYLVYQVTDRKTVKIIYFIDEPKKKVFVTDFFGSEMSESRIPERRSGKKE